jgi:hypothetical protein
VFHVDGVGLEQNMLHAVQHHRLDEDSRSLCQFSKVAPRN